MEQKKAIVFVKVEPEIKAALLDYVRAQCKEHGRFISVTEVFTQWVKSLQTSTTNH